MRRVLVGLVAAGSLLAAIGPALAYDDGGDYGNGNDQRRCHESENCRGSFSPGPFDRSPVDVHDNCVSLDCSGYGGPPKKGGKGSGGSQEPGQESPGHNRG